MKLKLTIKLLLYKFFTTNLGKIILRLLFFGVRVENLKSNNNPKKHPFLVVLTVDTESGYVEKNERRVWQMENPLAYQGYHYGIKNLLEIFEKHKIKSTFFLSTNCFSAPKNEYNIIKDQISNLIKNKHEIGLHLHPDSDLALQRKLSKKFNETSAFFYNYNEKFEIIKAARALIKENLGKNSEKNVISFRWGNWALDSDGAKALNKLGFKIDSSAVPGIKGHANDTMKYDWRNTKFHYPWNLSIENYQAINQNNSKILEIPIATFSFFGVKLIADPVSSILLNKAFLEYYKKTDRSERPFPFVVMTHSSEATYFNGEKTTTLKDLEKFISFAKKFNDIKFVTMSKVILND